MSSDFRLLQQYLPKAEKPRVASESGFGWLSLAPYGWSIVIAEEPKVNMANKTYGTISPERQKAMSGLEFVKGLVSGGAALEHDSADLGL